MKYNQKRLRQIIHESLFQVSLAISSIKLLDIPMSILTATLLGQIVTKATEGDITKVIHYAMGLLSVVIGIKLINSLLLIKVEQRKAAQLHRCKMSFYKELLNQRLDILYQLKNGEIIERLNDDFDTITKNYIELRPSLYIASLTAVVYFGFLGFQSLPIAFVLVIFSLIQMIPPLIVKKYIQVNYDQTRAIEAELTDFIVQGYEGFATLKLYGLREWYLERLRKINKEYLTIGCRGESACTLENMMDELVTNLLKYGTYGLIGLFILKQLTTLEVGVEAIALSGYFFQAVKSIFNQIPELARIEVAEERVISWFEEDKKEYSGIKILAPYIRLQDIVLQQGEKKLFEKMNMELSTKEITVIKGENGIGKSTLMKLIVGLIQAQQGEVCIGGIESTRFQLEKLREFVFYLPQEDTALEVTPQELIGLMKDVEEEKWLKIAIALGLTESLLTQSTLAQLSGGERKKVFLALAFTKESTYLLLDEPTNALDSEGKTCLKAYLKQRKGGALIITHDEECLEIADKVYTLKKEGEGVYASA